MAVPAVLYFIQNNLVVMSLASLPVAVFQVTYQCKILTTAMFSVLWLGRQINKKQVMSLLLLTAGVAVVQLTGVKPETGDFSFAEQLYGFVCVIGACFLSGCAGVYFEKVLKTGETSAIQNTILFRNFQLAGFTLLIGGPGVFYHNMDDILSDGITKGYTNSVWFFIILQALGGFVVATVVKHADQIQKGFAVSFAIVLGSVTSLFIWE